MRCKSRVKYTPKKNNHTQDSIYVVRQFAYVHEVAGISLFSEKNTKCGSTFFSLKNDIKTLISKTIDFLYPVHRFTMGYKKRAKIFSP